MERSEVLRLCHGIEASFVNEDVSLPSVDMSSYKRLKRETVGAGFNLLKQQNQSQQQAPVSNSTPPVLAVVIRELPIIIKTALKLG
jgi:pyoverdine/dityrosine biosynthesis protein Dit1